MSLVLLFLGGETPFTIHDATHGHLADNVSLTAVSVLTVQDAQHGHTADNVNILAVAVLDIHDATHGSAGVPVSPDAIFILPDGRKGKLLSGSTYLKL